MCSSAGRSAGGGIAIRLAINKYIVGLNLACPGHKSTGMEEFINYHKLNHINFLNRKKIEKYCNNYFEDFNFDNLEINI